MELTPGKLYKLKNIPYPRPFVYFINGFSHRCASRPGIQVNEMFLLVSQQRLSEIANKVHHNKMGFKILVEEESGWIWFRDDDPYDTYFEEVTELSCT